MTAIETTPADGTEIRVEIVTVVGQGTTITTSEGAPFRPDLLIGLKKPVGDEDGHLESSTFLGDHADWTLGDLRKALTILLADL